MVVCPSLPILLEVLRCSRLQGCVFKRLVKRHIEQRLTDLSAALLNPDAVPGNRIVAKNLNTP